MTDKTDTTNTDHGTIHTILSQIERIGQIGAWLIIPIIFVVLSSILASALKWGKIADWDSDIMLFGSRLTVASLGDMQWHLFGLMLMLTIAGTLIKDRHVRVDFFRAKMTERGKQIVDLIGHLVFLLPFCTVILWHGSEFAMRAFRTGEGSDYDGLYDRFLIKGTIPLGFGLLVVAGLLLIVREAKRRLYAPKNGDQS